MRRILFLLFSAALLFTSCKERFHISGTSSVSTLEGKTLYLKVFQDGNMTTIDSAGIVHGHFKFSGPMDSTTMACVFMDDICLVPVVLESGQVQLTLNEDQQYPSGAAMNDTLRSFIHKKAELELMMEELSRKESRMIMDGMDHDSIIVHLNREAEEINAESDRLITTFISRNYDNVLGAGVFMILTNNFPYPILNPQIEAVLGMGTPYFLENAYVKEYVRIAKENMEKLREEQE